MKQAIRIYPSIAWQTHSQIAVAVEEVLRAGHVASNEAAALIMRRLFDVDTTTHPDYPPPVVCGFGKHPLPAERPPSITIGHGSISLKCAPDAIQRFVDRRIAAITGVKPPTYLAGPYSHPDRAVRVQRFEQLNAFAAQLMTAGELVYSPISHTHPIAEAGALPLDWEFWKKYDTAFIEHSRRVVVLMLDGWRESKGVTAEIEIAKTLGTPVEYVTQPTKG